MADPGKASKVRWITHAPPKTSGGPYFRKPNSDLEAEYALKGVKGRPGRYKFIEQFQYVEPEHLAPNGVSRTFTVPATAMLGEFVTDFATIPAFATWLVPRDGTHAPAAFLHDALVEDKESCRTVDGPLLQREEADLVFRGALEVLGVPTVRRHLMWAAVNLATQAGKGRPNRLRGLLTVTPTVLVSALFNLMWVDQLFRGSLDWLSSGLSAMARSFSRSPKWVAALDWLGSWNLRWVGLVVLLSLIPWVIRTDLKRARRHLGLGLLTGGALVLFSYPLILAAWSFALYLLLEFILVPARRSSRRNQPVAE